MIAKVDSQNIIHQIPPVWNSESQILILGTMPSPKSREAGFFYMHPQNRFWKVLPAVFGEQLLPNDFSKIFSNSKIKHVFCTGKTAFSLWKKTCAKEYEEHFLLTVKGLPSTSPANASWTLEKLIAAYKVIASPRM